VYISGTIVKIKFIRGLESRHDKLDINQWEKVINKVTATYIQ